MLSKKRKQVVELVVQPMIVKESFDCCSDIVVVFGGLAYSPIDSFTAVMLKSSPFDMPLDTIEHPVGISVDIVGIEEGSCGRSCEEHGVCGTVLEENAVVRIRHVQILVDGSEESALAAYWIEDGIDRCHVGFLPRHLLKHWKEYDGRIAQIVEMYNDSENSAKRRKSQRNLGCCCAVLIDTVRYRVMYCGNNSKAATNATDNWTATSDDSDYSDSNSLTLTTTTTTKNPTAGMKTTGTTTSDNSNNSNNSNIISFTPTTTTTTTKNSTGGMKTTGTTTSDDSDNSNSISFTPTTTTTRKK